eukprot:gnl/MRDRNA2_/MRDRNA2_15541_c0_seq1.p1 gnl/MRDRNA2_/MRDRNA2_15541_c0~~gnl/MRDRNA2_/MRDRNA2_15541_c0_seq1.p1  ORF type:complete len:147 (+),score=38.18 gnl/MRDRNA2_/MRDRNA2_15541_c0_seq1:59-499(+)
MTEQSDDVSQFIAVTGSDEEHAKRFLAIAGGNLENAVTLYLDGGPELADAAGQDAVIPGGGAEDARYEADMALALSLQEEEAMEADAYHAAAMDQDDSTHTAQRGPQGESNSGGQPSPVLESRGVNEGCGQACSALLCLGLCSSML